MSDKHGSDKHGRMLIIEALTDDTKFMLINLYNANTENNQLTTFSKLTNMLENFDLTENKTVVFASFYFNICFNLFVDQILEEKVVILV